MSVVRCIFILNSYTPSYLTGFTGSKGFSFLLPPLAALGFCLSIREGQKGNNKNLSIPGPGLTCKDLVLEIQTSKY